MFFANIVNSLGNFIWPFLAIFLTDRLGMDKAGAGLVVTLSATVFAPGSLLGGKISDHFGRREVFLAARVFAALALLPCAFLGTSPVIPVLLVLTSFLTGAADPSISAMVTDLTRRDDRQRAFSLLYLGHNIGFAVGPMVAGLLYANHLPLLFIGDALTTLASVVLVARFVPETLPQRENQPEPLHAAEKAEKGGLVQALLSRPEVLGIAVILMVYSFVYTQSWFSLPIYLGDLFSAGGPKIFGMLMSVNAVTVVTLTALATKLTVKMKPISSIVLGGLFYAVGFGMIYYLRTIPLFILSTVLWTMGEIVIAVSSAAFVANNSPVSHRGRFNSFIRIVSGSGQAIGPTVMGRYIDRFGARMVWPVCFILALVSSLIALGVRVSKDSSALRKKTL
ncbi:MAG: MFS transporter [Firmicutes bacterium]|nr:MFS transporter [Bacillota bacterium]